MSTIGAPGDIALAAAGLVKRYRGGVLALDGVDLGIRRGLVTALVGPNAAGKSTLIKAWVGFESPTRGSLLVDGIDPQRDRSAALSRVGYVPQVPALYRDLTVGEHVALARRLRPGFDPAVANRRLTELSIPVAIPARRLSGGQAAQVMLALALGTRSPILLLDEPLASLDPLARREFLDVVRDGCRTDGTTVLLSSHVVRDVEQGCDWLVVLGVGRKLLDISTSRARGEHRVLSVGVSPPVGTTVVAKLPGADGTLVRVSSDDGDALGRPEASLEEVVVGYLVAGRRSPGDMPQDRSARQRDGTLVDG